MSGEIISFHSIRRGTGKSTIIANLAALLACQGKRVLIIEADFHSPSMKLFLRLPDEKISLSLTDYIAGKCEITQTVYLTNPYPEAHPLGQIFLLPASPRIVMPEAPAPGEFTFERLSQGLQQLALAYQPHVILIDNIAGMHDEALLSAAASHTMVLVLHTDQQDFQGAAVAVDLARKLKVPRICLALNNVPASINPYQARQHLENTYQSKVIAIIPQSDEIAALASAGLLIFENPNAPVMAQFRQALEALSIS